MLAGNVYNTPALLERSGVGRADVLANVSIPHVAQNDYIGDYFTNNMYLLRLPSGYWSADKYWGPEAYKSVFNSSLDLRGPNGGEPIMVYLNKHSKEENGLKDMYGNDE